MPPQNCSWTRTAAIGCIRVDSLEPIAIVPEPAPDAILPYRGGIRHQRTAHKHVDCPNVVLILSDSMRYGDIGPYVIQSTSTEVAPENRTIV